MSTEADDNDRDLLAHVLLPVANEEDTRVTATQLEPYDPEPVTALHVVEKGMGVPDKTPVEQSKELAEESYAAVRSVFPDADGHTAYAWDVVGAIFDAAEEIYTRTRTSFVLPYSCPGVSVRAPSRTASGGATGSCSFSPAIAP